MSLMKRNLRMKCSNWGHWNGVPANKIFIEQFSPEPKVKVFIPMYKPLDVTECKNYVCMHTMNGLLYVFHLINDAADFFRII